MLVIGLTGGIGSGKSTVAELFRQLGIEVIDADQLSREVVEPGQPALTAIAEYFGEEILDHEGQLRRGVLRDLIFDDPTQRQWLEKLLHPLINERILQRIEQCTTPYCIVMSPLLLESGQANMVDRILAVDVPVETQLARALLRDAGSRKTIEAIIAAQTSKDKRLESADDIIDNEKDVIHLTQAVADLHKVYLAMATQP